MITRIVQMTFDPKYIDQFIAQFNDVQPYIKSMPGCNNVELFYDSKHSNIMTTISVWESENHLNDYRKSELFLNTWAKTKLMFCAKPIAQTYYQIST